jgi:hypothetical protein
MLGDAATSRDSVRKVACDSAEWMRNRKPWVLVQLNVLSPPTTSGTPTLLHPPYPRSPIQRSPGTNLLPSRCLLRSSWPRWRSLVATRAMAMSRSLQMASFTFKIPLEPRRSFALCRSPEPRRSFAPSRPPGPCRSAEAPRLNRADQLHGVGRLNSAA